MNDDLIAAGIIALMLVGLTLMLYAPEIVRWFGRRSAPPTCKGEPDRTMHVGKTPLFTGGVRDTDAQSDTRYGADVCSTCGDSFIWVGDWHFHGRGSWARIPTPIAARRPRSDMYGHEIYPLGDTGYGVSMTRFSVPSLGPELHPQWAFFHKSDGYRQALFCVQIGEHGGDPHRPSVTNGFRDRIDEVMAATNG